MFERFFKNRYGYSRWDGTQQVEGLDADEILKALSDDYMENGNLQQALKRLMQDGMRSDEGKRRWTAHHGAARVDGAHARAAQSAAQPLQYGLRCNGRPAREA